MGIEQILAMLDRVSRSGNGWSARCPAHDDRNPSLSIKESDGGRILLRCHAGCSFEAVSEALGLQSTDLRGDATQVSVTGQGSRGWEDRLDLLAYLESQFGTLEGAWQYPTGDSLDAFEVIRLKTANGGKTYRPFHRRDGRWYLGDPPGSLPLYRIDKITGDVDAPVLILEGEKCVDVAVSLGFDATTSAHGANSAKKSDWTRLVRTGRDLVVLPDHGSSGQKYAVDVARLCNDAEVTLVDLPGLSDGEDIVEYVEHMRAEGQSDSDIRTAILALIDEAAPIPVEEADADVSDTGRESQVDNLLQLVKGYAVELFHARGSGVTEGYVTVPVGNHRETYPLESVGFRRWIRSAHYSKYEKAPTDQSLKTAIGTMEAMAVFDGDERQVAVRVAQVDGTIWLDLGRPEWEAVRVDSDGYSVVESESVGVRFIRPPGVQALPIPAGGGGLELLRDLINVGDDDWVLLRGYLVTALNPSVDQPILALSGEEGSAKSTLSRLMRRVIDPNVADVRRPFRNEQDLLIAANNSWVVAFDNLSTLSENMADALCCLSTGSALSTRTLYTTGEETIWSVKRPVILNGIPDLALRGDLASRCISLPLESVPPDRRRTLESIRRSFEGAHPQIFGALLDAVSCALRRQDSVELKGMPRMADMCVWVTASEPALGLADGEFLEVYERRLLDSVDAVIDASPIGSMLLAALGRSTDAWIGTATDMLTRLDSNLGRDRRPSNWPDSAQKLSHALRRIAPSLRKKGIPVVLPKPASNPRLITIGPLPAVESEKRGQARVSAGDPTRGGPKKADSRASALSALSPQTLHVDENGGVADLASEFGWGDQ